MSIDANPHTENQWTPVPTNTNAPAPRAKNIAAQIARGWNAMSDEERQLWRSATEAMTAEAPHTGQLHLKCRPIPTDRELVIDELLPHDSNHRAHAAGSSTRVAGASDLPTTTIPAPAGSTIPPPWRLPGALSDGLENVPLRAAVLQEYDEEAAKKFCMSLESEQHFQAFEAFLLAHRKPEVDADAAAEEERLAEVKRQRRLKKELKKMSKSLPTRFRNELW